jgi:hypothetical protein
MRHLISRAAVLAAAVLPLGLVVGVANTTVTA